MPVELVADVAFDLEHRNGLDKSPEEDQSRLGHPEGEGREKHRDQSAAVASADRPVDHGFHHERDDRAGRDTAGRRKRHNGHLFRIGVYVAPHPPERQIALKQARSRPEAHYFEITAGTVVRRAVLAGLQSALQRADNNGVSDPGDYFAAVRTLTPAVSASTAPAAPVRSAGMKWQAIAAAGLVVVLAVVGVLMYAGSRSSHQDDPTFDRTLGRNVGLMLPAPVNHDECVAAMKARFTGITSAAGQAAFITSCMTAHGPTDPALTSGQ